MPQRFADALTQRVVGLDFVFERPELLNREALP